ncbi:VOC family protein [Nocardia sp. SYP-A9097]|uniref:VOC family protein n=1 Tax=Nocardia sp. SYP-A9097 TaxID=2663237 RepID=UPI00129A63AA|nr:VOC family protein [Nocardia sp. SYP-A9097]MRH91468.1 VOC family protein [Nocardia sp. SYP-A9097]
MQWNLEVVPVPVSDLDNSKAFYTNQIGFTLDLDIQISPTTRIVQLTPPGSACSIHLSTAPMTPGSLHGLQLVVPDINTAHKELTTRGVTVSPITHFENGEQVAGPGEDWNSFIFFEDPDGNSWVIQERPAT